MTCQAGPRNASDLIQTKRKHIFASALGDEGRLVQLRKGVLRRAARVDEPYLKLLACSPLYELARKAMSGGMTLEETITKHINSEQVDYDLVYRGTSEWCLLPAIDHPFEPARCLISGTGLTHFDVANQRNIMHAIANGSELTDSMRLFHN